MSDLSSNSNSFIPKRGPATHRRGPASRQVYVFTLISYVLMFATLLSVGGVFLYSKYVEQQKDSEISGLNTDINSFSVTDMNEVLQFNRHLQQAYGRLDNTVAILSVFNILEASTVGPVEIRSLVIKREFDDRLLLKATVKTDTFDSTLFQRKIYNASDAITVVSIEELDVSSIERVPLSDGSNGTDDIDTEPFVAFVAEIEIPLLEVLYTVSVDDPVLNQTETISLIQEQGAAADFSSDSGSVSISSEGDLEVNNLDI